MTQRELANRIGVRSRSFVSRLESGVNGPTLSTMERVADALGVDVASLLQTTGSDQASQDRIALAEAKNDLATARTILSRIVQDWERAAILSHNDHDCVYRERLRAARNRARLALGLAEAVEIGGGSK